jgi:ribosomal protein L12E/L44/L45/RPP1/RPP2
MSAIVEINQTEMSIVTANTPTKEPRVKAPVLQAKYLRYKVYSFWLLNQVKNKGCLTTETLNELYNTIELFSTVETQTAFYEQFEKELFKEVKKNMNKEITAQTKPPKKPPAKKAEPTDENKPKAQRKKKTQVVETTAPSPKKIYITS